MNPDFERNVLKGKSAERYFDFNQALFEFHELFNKDETSERSIAILGGTFLEMTLEHILYSFLPEDEKEVEKLFEYNSPLGNFSYKIQMAYCLGLIEKVVKADLHLVRKIRNKFAHELILDFEDEQIDSWCRALEWHKIASLGYIPEGVTSLMLFQVGVNRLISNLSGHLAIARNEKRSIMNNFG